MSGNSLVPPLRMQLEVVESLYREALLLLDEIRVCFAEIGADAGRTRDIGEGNGGTSRPGVSDPAGPQAVLLYGEGMKATMRIAAVIAWLLQLRTLAESEPVAGISYELTPAPAADPAASILPDNARILIAASEELYRRAKRLQAMIFDPVAPRDNAVHRMVARLENAIGGEGAI